MRQAIIILVLILPLYFYAQNNCLDFDGIDDYVTCGTSINLANQTFTIEFWAKKDDTGINYVTSQGTITGNNGLHIGFRNSTTFTFAFYFNDLDVTGVDDLWHHWACVYVANTIGTDRFIYRDGVLVASDDANGNFTGGGSFNIGVWRTDHFNGRIDEVRIWNIERCAEEIVYYKDCELTGNEEGLLAYYKFDQGSAGGNNSGVTTLDDATTNSYDGTLIDFELMGSSSNWVTSSGGSGNACSALPVIPDISVNEIIVGTDFGVVGLNTTSTKTFTITNEGLDNLEVTGITSDNSRFVISNFSGPVTIPVSMTTTFDLEFTPTTPGYTSAEISISSNDCNEDPYAFNVDGVGDGPACSLNFDGVDDFISCGNGINISNSSFTIEFWAKKEVTGANYVASQGVISTNNGLHIGFRNGTTFTFAFYANDLNVSGIVDNEWHHWACVYEANISGTDRFIYRDGVEVASDDANGNFTGSGFFNIGTWSGFFNGNIDEFRIWNTARSSSEINTYKDCELVGSETGLLAYYQFNQGFADANNSGETTLNDATSNNNNGTLTNFAFSGIESNWTVPCGVTTDNACLPLPIELVNFYGRLIADETKLFWTTASELSSKGFEIQKSQNGRDWEVIGFVEGQGTTNEINEYQYQDKNPFSGINYYRLLQIDFDGAFEYSKVITVEYNTKDSNIVVFPNPSNGLINLRINNPSNQRMEIKVLDNLGRTIRKSEFVEGESDWRKEIEIECKGIYLVFVQIGDELYYKRVIITE